MTEHTFHREPIHHLARITLFGFILTFIVSRVMVFLIMADEVPNFYFFLRGTHVHHLNYGIFLLAWVCGYSVFRRPMGRASEATALLYGISLGLMFDEFGLWLHLGGSYWQRASVDMVIVVAAVLGLVGFATTLRQFETKHFWAAIILGIVLAGFGVVLYTTGAQLMGPRLQELEAASSP